MLYWERPRSQWRLIFSSPDQYPASKSWPFRSVILPTLFRQNNLHSPHVLSCTHRTVSSGARSTCCNPYFLIHSPVVLHCIHNFCCKHIFPFLFCIFSCMEWSWCDKILSHCGRYFSYYALLPSAHTWVETNGMIKIYHSYLPSFHSWKQWAIAHTFIPHWYHPNILSWEALQHSGQHLANGELSRCPTHLLRNADTM